MRGARLALAAALLVAACDRSPRPSGDPATNAAGDELRLSATEEGSVITAATTAADLARRFGAASVADGDIPLAEGEGTAGTILFPDDTTRRAEIVWRDSAQRARPDFVRVGSSARRWSLAPGIRVGTSLPELERLNGGPFMVAGFETRETTRSSLRGAAGGSTACSRGQFGRRSPSRSTTRGRARCRRPSATASSAPTPRCGRTTRCCAA